jgi:hypothetical protein
MGSFYVNLAARTADQSAVAAALAGRSAFVTPPHGECVAVADEESDAQDQEVIRSLAQSLSSRLDCAVLAVLNHDDDILWYCLSRGGQIVDEYDSSPGYFDPEAEPSPPAGGNAKQLCAAFGSPAWDRVEEVLRKSSFDDDGYVFASERHADLVAALGLPSFSVGFGFGYASEGDLPEGLSADQLLRVK